MRLINTSPLVYTVEYSQIAVDSGLAFSVGIFKEKEEIQQLFPYCWCRDVLCNRINELYIRPRLYEEFTPVLLIRDFSFKEGSLENFRLFPHLSPLQYMEKFISFQRESMGRAEMYLQLDKIYFQFPFLISYIALILRAGEYNRKLLFEKFVAICNTAQMYNAQSLTNISNKQIQKLFSLSLLNSIQYVSIQSCIDARGPLDILNALSYYKQRPKPDTPLFYSVILDALEKHNETK